jgi:hypothetical protein
VRRLIAGLAAYGSLVSDRLKPPGELARLAVEDRRCGSRSVRTIDAHELSLAAYN